MSMAYGDFAAFMADVDEAFRTWDKVRPPTDQNVRNHCGDGAAAFSVGPHPAAFVAPASCCTLKGTSAECHFRDTPRLCSRMPSEVFLFCVLFGSLLHHAVAMAMRYTAAISAPATACYPLPPVVH